jgi:hypothetical protein
MWRVAAQVSIHWMQKACAKMRDNYFLRLPFLAPPLAAFSAIS